MKRRQISTAALLLTISALFYAGNGCPGAVEGSTWASVPGGLPRAESFWTRLTTHTLQNPGFVVGYSEWRRDPLWVAFRATPIHEQGPVTRPDHFSVDERTLARVSSEDFRGSPYDRGHLAPNYLISRLYGSDAQQATFLMSNIAPQTRRLNQLLWQRIEEAEADVVAPRIGELWVITGPIFGTHMPLDSGVEVPEAFYRIWFDAHAATALAFIVPQEVCGDEPLTNYLATVDEVEHRTGLDFFSTLDAAEQERIESSAADVHWNVESFSHSPPRYAENFKGRPCTGGGFLGLVDAAGLEPATPAV